ncbi:MAG: membrane protein insertase YidC [Thiohalomonadales bacterium]
MENQRLFLFIALSIVVMLLFNAWQDQYGPKPLPQLVQQPTGIANSDTENSVGRSNSDIPSSSTPIGNAVDNIPKQARSEQPLLQPLPETTDSSAANKAQDSELSTKNSTENDKRIRVRTDLLDIELSSKGGDIQRAALLDYPYEAAEPDVKVQLFDDKLPNLMIAQGGVLAKKGFSPSINHHTYYDIGQTEYQLAPGADSVDVVFTYEDPTGFTVIKTLTFKRNSYVIDVNYQLQNNTGKEWTGSMYRQIQRTKPDESNQSKFIYTFTGSVVSTPENKYEKITLDDMAEWKSEQGFTKGGWIAMSQHYFLGVVIPDALEFNRFYSKVINESRYIIGAQTSEFSLANRESKNISSRYFIGPKEQSRLGEVAPNLDLAIDFGVLTIIAHPLFWLLNKFHEILGNWGFAIILVTLCVKLVFFKLSEAAYRSMANMRRFQPRIQQLRERYINDKQRMSQAMMELYKKEKINPLGGCLPMLVQIPVFISLYWVLLESVELRQADFIWWLNDLSAKDPFYVLPVLMGASMLIQQRLNPAPMDPMQQKIMQLLPIVFTLFFAFFPSGLVLYWVVNNVLSISQQWYITRKIELAHATPASTKSDAKKD